MNLNLTTIELVPAYGRSYKTVQEFQKDFDLGLDFNIKFGPMMNKEDLQYMLDDGVQNVYIKINHRNVYLIRNGSLK